MSPLSKRTAVADGDRDALSVASLDVRYAEKRVLVDVNLRIASGSIVTLLGANGAGKTTLMRAICGRLRPHAGTILVDGRPCREVAARRRIGFVPQEIALYPALTPRENLRFFGRLADLRGKVLDHAVAKALEQTRLSERADTLVRQLSGGYQRRVNIAAGILHRPALLILDEPLVGVDLDARQALQEVIAGLAEGGMAVLMTTHDLQQAEALSDRVAVLVDGRLVADGPANELISAAFGDHCEMSLVVERELPPQLGARLTAAGLLPDADRLRWRGELSGGLASARQLIELLTTAGADVHVCSVSRPDLASLYRRLVAGEVPVR